jgi:hypothetical protein
VVVCALYTGSLLQIQKYISRVQNTNSNPRKAQILALLPEQNVVHGKRLVRVAYRAEILPLRAECVEADNVL